LAKAGIQGKIMCGAEAVYSVKIALTIVIKILFYYYDNCIYYYINATDKTFYIS